jgi:hypothetical protein
MVHRTVAQYGLSDSENDERDMSSKVGLEYGAVNHYIQASRTICFETAIQVARITQCHRKRFNTSRIFVTGMQHAGTAATALIASIARIKDPLEQVYPLQHLRILTDSLKDMAYIYRPAVHMLNVLEQTIHEFGWNMDHLTGPSPCTPSHHQSSSRETPSTESQRTPQDSVASHVNLDITRNSVVRLDPATKSDDSDMFMIDASTGDFNCMDMSYSATDGAHTMSRMMSVPASDQFTCAGRQQGRDRDFVSLDAAMMLLPRSDLMHHPDMAGPREDSSVLVDQNAFLAGALSDPDGVEPSYKTKSIQCGQKVASGRGPYRSVGAPMAAQLSWDDILTQMTDSVV